MGRVRFELTMFLVWRFYRPLASAILHTYLNMFPFCIAIVIINFHYYFISFFFHIFNMLDFFSIGRKIQNILKYFSNPFSANRFPDQPHQILLYPLEQESSVTFACLTFLLYSFRLDRIFTLHSLLYQDRLYTFLCFCHHILRLTFVLMYTACTEIWTLDLEIKSFLLYQTKLYRRFPGFILQCAWRDSNTRYTG